VVEKLAQTPSSLRHDVNAFARDAVYHIITFTLLFLFYCLLPLRASGM